MKLETSTTYNKELIGKAALVYWKRTFALTFAISVSGIFVALIFVLYLDFKDWVTGSFLALSIISSIIFFWTFFIYRNRSMAIFLAMEVPRTKWTFTEESISTESDVGKSEIRWNLLKGIIKSNDLWLLVYVSNAYSVFPVKNVPDEVLAFISGKIEK